MKFEILYYMLLENYVDVNEYIDAYINKDWNVCGKIAEMAGNTQRGIPESVMLNVTIDIRSMVLQLC